MTCIVCNKPVDTSCDLFPICCDKCDVCAEIKRLRNSISHGPMMQIDAETGKISAVIELRDYFAARSPIALTDTILTMRNQGNKNESIEAVLKYHALLSYAYADAMLAKRAKATP